MSLLLHSPFVGEVDQIGVAAGFIPGTRMTAKKDIRLAAQGMLVVQGQNAVRECESVIESRRQQGDQIGVEKWTLVLGSIHELLDSD